MFLCVRSVCNSGGWVGGWASCRRLNQVIPFFLPVFVLFSFSLYACGGGQSSIKLLHVHRMQHLPAWLNVSWADKWRSPPLRAGADGEARGVELFVHVGYSGQRSRARRTVSGQRGRRAAADGGQGRGRDPFHRPRQPAGGCPLHAGRVVGCRRAGRRWSSRACGDGGAWAEQSSSSRSGTLRCRSGGEAGERWETGEKQMAAVAAQPGECE